MKDLGELSIVFVAAFAMCQKLALSPLLGLQQLPMLQPTQCQHVSGKLRWRERGRGGGLPNQLVISCSAQTVTSSCHNKFAAVPKQ